MKRSIIIGLVFYLLFAGVGLAESAPLSLNDSTAQDTLLIDKIFVIGNKKTKEQIIRRELSIKDGQLLAKSELDEFVQADKRKLMNTQLFLSVEINIIELSPEKVDIIIRVSERWYFFPSPIFNLADRNFTEWWVNQNHDFSRVDYGIRLRHFNFRGRREVLSLIAQFGYTKLFRLSYQFPYIDKKQKVGLGFYGDYATNKNIAYRTIEHRQQFLDSETLLRDRWRGGITIALRPNFYSLHNFGLHFSSTTIADTVAKANPNYFFNGELLQRYFAFSYSFIWDLRDFKSYPLTGSYLRVAADKIGLGIYDDINILAFNARYARYFDLGKKFYFGTSITGDVTSPSSQPYYNYQGVGNGRDFLRGYERYIIEGQNYVINKNSIKRQLFSFEADISKVLKIKQFSKIPFSAYFSLNFDHGYISNYPDYQENTLFTNRYIYGGGVGIDIISFYDFVMRWEYSMNIEGEHALYFNLFASF